MKSRHIKENGSSLRGKHSKLTAVALAFASVLPLLSCGKAKPPKREKQPAPAQVQMKTSSVCKSKNPHRVQYNNRGPCPKDCLPLVGMVEALATKNTVRVGGSVGPIILHMRNGGLYAGHTVDKYRVTSLTKDGITLGECSDYGQMQGNVLKLRFGESRVITSEEFSHSVTMVISVSKGPSAGTATVESGPAKK